MVSANYGDYTVAQRRLTNDHNSFCRNDESLQNHLKIQTGLNLNKKQNIENGEWLLEFLKSSN